MVSKLKFINPHKKLIRDIKKCGLSFTEIENRSGFPKNHLANYINKNIIFPSKWVVNLKTLIDEIKTENKNRK